MAIFNVVWGGTALQDAINVAGNYDEILVDDGIKITHLLVAMNIN